MKISTATAAFDTSLESRNRADAKGAEGPRGHAWGRRAKEAGAGPGEVAEAVRRLKADAFERSSQEVPEAGEASGSTEVEGVAVQDPVTDEVADEAQATDEAQAPVPEDAQASADAIDPAPEATVEPQPTVEFPEMEPAPLSSPATEMGFYGFDRLAVEVPYQLDLVV